MFKEIIMYSNIGKKLKGLAKALFIIDTIAVIIIGIAFVGTGLLYYRILQYRFFIFGGIATIVIGPVLSWISSWFLYGFGELIDKTSIIARNTQHDGIK